MPWPIELVVFSAHPLNVVNLLILVGFFWPELHFAITDNYKSG